MKKLTTMFAAMAIGVATMVAAPVNPGVRTDLRITGTTDAFKMYQPVLEGHQILGDETVETRSWTSGTSIYEARFQLLPYTLCEMLTFDDGNGNIVNPTFDTLPYYVVQLTYTRRKVSDESPNTYVTFYLAWPSQYIYNQLFEYTGVLEEDGTIPVEERNYDAVTADELFNNPDRCRRFQESMGAGADGSPSDDKWNYYTMVPNSVVGNVGIIDGNYVTTVVTSQIASYIELLQYSEDDDWTQFYSQIYYSEDGTDSGTRQVRIGTSKSPYDGTSDVQGWTEKLFDLPEFGDLYVFNTGVMSSELLGDNNPFPVEFPELTALFFTISDKYILWKVDDTYSGKFNREKFITEGADVPNGQSLIDHANYVEGYFFADPKYGKDTSLNLDATDFVVQPLEQVQYDQNTWWYESTPAIDSMIPYGATDMNGNSEPWAEEYGCNFVYHNMPEIVYDPSFIGWGYPQGIIVNMENETLGTYYATSKGKIYYYYDPNNMKVFRELSPVGERDGVETVTAEGAGAKVISGNGMITVRTNSDAEVAVYGLDGVCLKTVKAVAGEDVNVEAGKGVYVVRVDNKAVKVAL